MALTSTGLDVPTLAQIKAEIDAQARATIDPRIDLSDSSPQGQLVGICARQIRKAWEALAALYSAADPDAATGVALDHLAALTGTVRAEPTRSRVTATVTVDAGTYPAGTLVAHVLGRPDARFASLEEVVGPGSVAIVFEAEDPGPIAAEGGTLTEIASPVAGWTAVTNASDATLGRDRETDPELRRRRRREVDGIGSASTDAIRAAISALPGVVEVSVIENDTDATVGGVPPKAAEAVVYGPSPATAEDDQRVAEAIHATKSAGIRAHGSDFFQVVDASGFTQSIGFTRAAEVACRIEVDLDIRGDGSYVGDLTVRETILREFLRERRVGLDVTFGRIVQWAMMNRGALNVSGFATAIRLDTMGAAVIGPREIATLDIAEIDVTSNVVTP